MYFALRFASNQKRIYTEVESVGSLEERATDDDDVEMRWWH